MRSIGAPNISATATCLPKQLVGRAGRDRTASPLSAAIFERPHRRRSRRPAELPGKLYRLANRVVTQSGRIDERSIMLRVEKR